ncbi:MAG: aminotransferase class I/II-fold pyridoxal phosphate-dependent enzyme, partial [Planctomycetota bacterium]|jgi:aspartate/methionine/tyrosine aminotransferase
MSPIRDFPSFEYLRFAKTHQAVGKFNFLSSGLPSLEAGDIPHPEDGLPINGKSCHGSPDLIRAVASHHGVPIDEVCLAPGTSGVNFFLAGVLLGPGDEAVVESPTYEILHKLPALFGATAVRWERPRDRGFRPTADSLIPLLTGRTRAIFITNPHNPSGVLLDKGELAVLSSLASERSAHLVVDEVYLDMVESPIPSRTLGGTTVSTASLTKVYGLGGLRIGWALAPPDIVHALNRFHDLATVNCSVPAQALALEALGLRLRLPQIILRCELVESARAPPGGVRDAHRARTFLRRDGRSLPYWLWRRQG